VESGKLTALVLAGLIFIAGVVFICLPFHTIGLIRYYEPEQKVSCRPAVLIGWTGTNPSQNGVQSACGGPARTRLIFGGGIAVAVAVGVTAALLLPPRRRTHSGV
jgi:hypothetical protein